MLSGREKFPFIIEDIFNVFFYVGVIYIKQK